MTIDDFWKKYNSQLQERIDLINKDYFDLQLAKYAEALEMAIEALHQFAGDSKKVSAEGQHKKDLISKADVCEILADVFPTDGEKVVYVEEIENAYQEIIALPYIQPFVIHCTDCEDWYKRQSVWNVAISELPSAQPEKRTIKRTETHSCDLISRAMLLEYIHNEPVGKMLCDKYNLDGVIKQLPSAQPTLYGYNIEHLELIARVLQKEDLPPERVAEALTDIGRIVAIVRDEFEKALRKAVEQ